MTTRTTRQALALAVLALGTAVPAAHAAPPDGAGGWADAIPDYAIGVTSSGKPVERARSRPAAALGVAEDTFEPAHFFSMGVGGRVVLSFDNLVCNGPGADLRLVEATQEPYPDERIDVSVSADGRRFVTIARGVNKDADLAFPAGVPTVRFVGLVDATDPRGPTADGYDLDGVRALHTSGCAAPPAPPAPSGTVGGGPGSASGGDPGSGSGDGAPSGSAPETGGSGVAAAPAALATVDMLAGRVRSSCRVPRRVLGRTVAEVRRRLVRRRCRVGRVVLVKSRRVARRRVVRTTPRGGAVRPWRAKVTLYVSRGPR